MKISAEAQFRSWLAEVARASPLNSTVDFGESKSLVAVVESKFTITARDPLGQPRFTGGDLGIAVEIKAKEAKAATDAKVRIVDNHNGSYTVLYCVPQTGEYLVSVLVGGDAIAGSPFTVNAVRPSKPSAEILFKESVSCIATGADDLLYVAFNDHVRVLKLDGREIRRWGSKGKGEGQFTNLRLVAVSGNWVVAADGPLDTSGETERMQLFTSDGTFVRSCGTLVRVQGIAIDSHIGQIFVAGHDGIWAFNLLGDLLDWGKTHDGVRHGSWAGLAMHPGPPRILYVTDRDSHRVQAYGDDGNCVCKWGRSGDAAGEFWGNLCRSWRQWPYFCQRSSAAASLSA